MGARRRPSKCIRGGGMIPRTRWWKGLIEKGWSLKRIPDGKAGGSGFGEGVGNSERESQSWRQGQVLDLEFIPPPPPRPSSNRTSSTSS